MNEYYPGIAKINYEGKESRNPLTFRFYNPEAKVAGKSMREHLKFAMSYWHTMVAEGADMFGSGTLSKKYGTVDPMESARNKARAAFELMDKLGIDYYCFHDRDIAPEGSTLQESNDRLDEISDLLLELQKQSGKKVLWGTANLFSNPRYAHGAGTAPEVDVFAFAAAQIKKALEVTVTLGGQGYVFWGGREGYETLLNTNMGLELDNLARLMRLAVDYGRSIGFTGDFYVEPKPKEPTKHQYDFDAATVIGFLRHYGLDQDFKLNIEANHATLAGHTFQHELQVSADAGLLGSIDANRGDYQNGWDTDQFPNNINELTEAMLVIIEAGGFGGGGINFDAKIRRNSTDPADLFYAHIGGMDTFARALIAADNILKHSDYKKIRQDRYASFDSGKGKDFETGKLSLEDLRNLAVEMGEPAVKSGKQEYLENLVNRYI